MRRVILALVLVGLWGCAGEEKPPEPRRAPPPPPPGETMVIDKPGSTRAFIYTWRTKLPLELGAWVIADAKYTKTDTFANQWAIAYVATGRPSLSIAAEEHATVNAAKERYESAEAALARGPRHAALEVAERGHEGVLEAGGVPNAVAIALSGKYFFAFRWPESREVEADLVRTFVGICLAPDPSPVGS